MNGAKMNYIVIDLEYNQNFDFTTGARAPSNPLLPLEIIQFGAIKLDKNLEIIDQFGTMVAPGLYRRLNPFVAKVTGFDNRTLRESPPFSVAYNGLLRFMGRGKGNVLCFWGNDDMKELLRNAIFYGQNPKFLPLNYINIQQLASVFFEHPPSQQMALRTAVENLDIDASLPFHNAVNDAIYTAEVFKCIYDPENVKIIRFNLEKLIQNHAEIARNMV